MRSTAATRSTATTARSGTVTSFDSATGELVITTPRAARISALVTDDTHIQCRHEADDDDTATVSRHGDDDDTGDDDATGDDDNPATTTTTVTTTAITATTVTTAPSARPTTGRRHGRAPARIDLDGDDAVWTKLKLAS